MSDDAEGLGPVKTEVEWEISTRPLPQAEAGASARSAR
jgi:hypothetical protein